VRHIDGTQGAGLVARKWQDWQADACFIDDTGGFGSSWIDNLRRLGREPSASPSPAAPPTRATTTSGRRCISRRSTGSARAAPCLRRGKPGADRGAQPDDLLLPRRPAAARAEGPGEGAAGLFADDADAFVLTFAQPVAPRERFWDRTMEAVGLRRRSRPGRAIVEYDPLEGT
jgi:hypothetical protein